MNRLLRYFQSNLQRQLLLQVIPLVVIPIALTLLIVGYTSVQSSINQLQEEDLTFTREALRDINNDLQSVDDDVLFLAELDNLKALGLALATGDSETIGPQKTESLNHLVSMISTRGSFNRLRFIAPDGQEIIRVEKDPVTGETSVVPDEELVNQSAQPIVRDAIKLPAGGLFVSELSLNKTGVNRTIQTDSAGNVIPTVRYSSPVYATDATGQPRLVGVVVGNVNAAPILSQLNSDIEGRFVWLLDPNGYFLFNSRNRELEFAFEAGISAFGKQEGEGSTIQTLLPQAQADSLVGATERIEELSSDRQLGNYLIHYVRINPPAASPNNYYTLAVLRDQDLLIQPIIVSSILGIALATLLIGLIAIVVTLIARRIARPIAAVTAQAERMASGELAQSVAAEITNRADELGTLGRSFNTMSGQLAELVGSLEARVKTRTNNLEAAAEIAAAANQVRELSDLISLTVNLIRDRFDFYYVQIYLLDETREYAVLRDGTGYVGRRLLSQNHRLPLDGRSLVANTVRTGQGAVVQDTRADANFLPNPLLPETRSELTVPLKVGDEIIGVMDIQHSIPNAFDDISARFFQSLADQLAVTFENVNLYQTTNRRAGELATVAEVGLATTQNLNVTALLRSAVRLTRDNFALYHAHIYLADEAREWLNLAAGVGEPGLIMMERGHRIAYGKEHSLVARAARTGEAVISNDVTQEPDYLPNELLPLTRSEMALPLKVGDTILGVLDVQAEQVKRFSAEDAQVLGTLASQIAVALNNARAFDAVRRAEAIVRENEARLRAVTENFPNGAIVVYDTQYRYQLVDGTGLEEVGLSKAGMEGRTVDEVFPELADGLKQQYAAALAGEESRAEVPFADRIYEVLNSPIRDHEGKVVAGMTITQNVTLRKQTEEQQRILLNISNRLSTANDPQAVLDSLLDYAQERGATSANIYYLSTNAEGVVDWTTVMATWVGHPEATPPAVGTRFYMPAIKLSELWLAHPNEATFIADTQTDERVDAYTRDIYAQLGIHGTALLPLYAQGRWVGILTFDWREAHTFSESEKSLFIRMQQQTTYTVDAVRSAAETAQRAADLALVAEVGARINRITDLEPLLQEVAHTTTSSFNAYHLHIYIAEDDGQTLYLAAGAGKASCRHVNQNYRVRLAEQQTLVARAVQERATLVVNDSHADDSIPVDPNLPDSQAQMIIPLFVADTLVGVMEYHADEVGFYQERQISVFNTLAAQIAVALQNARLFETEKRQEAQLLRSLKSISTSNAIATIVQQNYSLETMLEQALGVLLESFEADNAVVSVYDGESDRWAGLVGAGQGMDSQIAKTIIDPGAAYPHGQAALQQQRVVAVDEAKRYPNFPLSYTEDESIGIKSVLVLPLIVEGQFTGVVFLNYNRQAHHFGQDELELAASAMAQLTTGIEAIQLAETLQIRNIAIESTTVGVTIADAQQADMPLIYVNQAFTQTTGYSFQESVGRNCRFLQRDDRQQADLPILREALKNGQGTRVTLRNYRKDGALFYNELSVSPVYNRDGVLTHFIGLSTDVTERVELEHEQDLLFEATLRLGNAATPSDVLQALQPYASEHGAQSGAIIYLYGDPKDPEQAKVVATWKQEGTRFELPLGIEFPMEGFAMRESLLTSGDELVPMEHMLADPRLDEATRAFNADLGIGASIYMPLRTPQRWVGFVVFNWPERHVFSNRELRIFDTLMRESITTIDALRATEEVREAAQIAEKRARELATIARVSSATTTILERDKLLQAVVDLTKESFGLYHAHIYLLDADGEKLQLAAGAGEAGRQMRQRGHAIKLSAGSLVARSARTKQAVTINDVTDAPDFLPNPMLPDTRSEMAIPMLIGDDLIGVLDVQSEQVGRFSEEDVRIKSTLADQVAVAIRNAEAFERERRTIERLREVDRLKQEFLANMSHELRTPLNSIIGYSEVLMDGIDGDLGEEALVDVRTIHDSGKHLLALINDILDMAKIEAGQMTLNRKMLNVADIIEDVVQSMHILVKDSAVAMISSATSAIPEMAVDPLRIKQVMLNLMSNAVKFTEAGSIQVRYGVIGECLRVEVSDTGRGISAEHQKLIFERFRQVDGSSTRQAGGTGLGLAITREFIHMHGGEIGVVSAPGEGSTFWFELPLVHAAAPVAPALHNS